MNESMEAPPNELDDGVKMPLSFSVLFDGQKKSYRALNGGRCEGHDLLFRILPEICHPRNITDYLFLAVLQP